MANGSLGVDATPFPEPLSVSAVEDLPPVGPLAVSGGGGAEAVLDLTSDVPLVEIDAPRVARLPGLLRAAPWQLVAKRAVDIVGSIAFLIVLLPLLALTAGAVLVTSRGPVLYVHERIGRDGRPFRMLKFRSMRLEAHEIRDGVLHLNEANGPVFKIRDDPRMTAVGRLLRRLSLDELPQLVNVLVGDMSLVGPRPPLPEEFATYSGRVRRRLTVTPGITCIWQVSGRSDLDFETWVEMDLDYIDSWTLRKDLMILLRTVPAVLSGRGAY